MSDLFSQDTELRKLDMQDGEVFYLPSLKLPAADSTLLQRFIAETPWRQEHVVVWGKRHPQPRLVAWYGDSDRSYTYSGIHLVPLPWTDLLMQVRAIVEKAADFSFNSVLLNYYRDQRDSMGFHSDDEPELGKNPVIASLSIGEQRTFIMKHKIRKDVAPVRLPLQSGSLLIMKGATQHNWKHGIDKESRRCAQRVNLTFRQIQPGPGK